MNGIINKEDSVMKVFGKDCVEKYISVITRGKLDEEKLFDSKMINDVFDNIRITSRKIGNAIKDGIINANPIGGRIDSCAFCKFNSICKFDSKIDKKRKPLELKNSEVFMMLEGEDNA